MRPPLQIKVSSDAQAQIEEAAAWWAKNRLLAPGAVREDLDRILGLLSVNPGIGARARRATLQGVRRVTLSRIRYYLYYRVSGDALEVLAFWHTSRGRQPQL
ncbi:MAG: type II toxin-antitoxin system RelE/ParE family toxin [Betaproteobacteria bacterium]